MAAACEVCKRDSRQPFAHVLFGTNLHVWAVEPDADLLPGFGPTVRTMLASVPVSLKTDPVEGSVDLVLEDLSMHVSVTPVNQSVLSVLSVLRRRLRAILDIMLSWFVVFFEERLGLPISDMYSLDVTGPVTVTVQFVLTEESAARLYSLDPIEGLDV